MKLKLAKLTIFGSKVLSLWRLGWVGCQTLLSDRYQIDIIRLTLWQGVNSPLNQEVWQDLGEAITLLQF